MINGPENLHLLNKENDHEAPLIGQLLSDEHLEHIRDVPIAM